MTNEEKLEKLARLKESQLNLESVMAQSDAHASKCQKLGLSFADKYPAEFSEYVSANEQWHANEEEFKRIEAIVPEVSEIAE